MAYVIIMSVYPILEIGKKAFFSTFFTEKTWSSFVDINLLVIAELRKNHDFKKWTLDLFDSYTYGAAKL